MVDHLFTDSRFIIFLAIFIPFSAAICSSIVNDDRFRASLNIFFSILLFLLMAGLFNSLFKLLFAKGLIIDAVFCKVMPGVYFKFSIEPLGVVFILLASFLWVLTNLYAYGYMFINKEKNLKRFSVFFALSITSVMGVGLSGNLFTMFVFYELLTIFTYPLVTHYGDAESRKAGKLYLYMLMTTSTLFLAGIVFTLQYAETVDFVKGGILEGKISGLMCGVILFCFVYGVGKAALMPIHRWLPAAMVAPVPVSALLHAVAVVKAGVFIILKVVIYIFGVDLLAAVTRSSFISGGWLVYVAGITVILASIAALRQSNLKKLLAYSTISQLAYITMSAGIFSPLAIIGGILHLVSHSFAKITLFFTAGSIYSATDTLEIDKMKGIGKRMPVTMVAFTIAAISIIGVPPTIGFVSKFFIISGAVDVKNYFAIGVMILSTFISASYYLPIIYNAFFEKPEIREVKESIFISFMTISLSISAISVIILFFNSDNLVNFLSSTMGK